MGINSDGYGGYVQGLSRQFYRRQVAGVRTPLRLPVSRSWSFLLSLVPAITLGLGAGVPLLNWGLRLRIRRVLAFGTAYGAASCLCIFLFNRSDT